MRRSVSSSVSKTDKWVIIRIRELEQTHSITGFVEKWSLCYRLGIIYMTCLKDCTLFTIVLIFVLPLLYSSEGIIAEFVWGMCYYGIFVVYICREEVIGAV